MTELPTTFGKYFLTEKLATGGMAEIYLAKIMGPGGFEKSLVIKQIHPKLSGQRHFVDLFVNEAKTLVTLTHGNIVPVYELGVIDDTYFIAMEYIDGPTLYRLTEALARQDERMEPALAAFITARILEGLDYAHRKGEGVIHRDLSPRNVMLSRDGEVKLVDFGIAVTLGAADDSAVQSAPTGSFPYMSPEQVRREALSGQTDLFSSGVLLWEMLVGKRLFARNDPDATLAAVTSAEIARPSAERDDVPAKLDEVAMRALERDQTARWPSASEMLAQLQKYLYALEETPGPRDVAALVAKYCPPETRRMPTHADPIPAGDGDAPPPPAGPRTAVIPRDAPEPHGKKSRARTETFATNVELRNMLERATPMFGVQAMPAGAANENTDDESVATNISQPAITATERDDDSPRASSRAIPRASRAGVDVDQGQAEPVTSRWLVFAAIGTLLIGAIALVMFLKNRATTEVDAAFVAATPDGLPMGVEAGGLDADLDAPTPPDAPVDATPIDAKSPLRIDAATMPPIDAAPRPTGFGTLKIGANPWGDVFIDGVKKGRAPTEIPNVPAGKHVVEIIFSGEDPPRTKKQTIDLSAGEVEEMFVDFTKP